MHAFTPGFTIEECRDTLTEWLDKWSGRNVSTDQSDWTVTYAVGHWHAANGRYELAHVRYYEDCFRQWREELAERLGVYG